MCLVSSIWALSFFPLAATAPSSSIFSPSLASSFFPSLFSFCRLFLFLILPFSLSFSCRTSSFAASKPSLSYPSRYHHPSLSSDHLRSGSLGIDHTAQRLLPSFVLSSLAFRPSGAAQTPSSLVAPVPTPCYLSLSLPSWCVILLLVPRCMGDNPITTPGPRLHSASLRCSLLKASHANAPQTQRPSGLAASSHTCRRLASSPGDSAAISIQVHLVRFLARALGSLDST